MLKTSKQLGDAIKSALEAKGFATKAAIARHWEVKGSSVSGWFQDGRIATDKLLEIMDMCSDQFGPEHWGLKSWPGAGALKQTRGHYSAKVLPFDDSNPLIEEAVRILRATDEKGRLMGLGALKGALSGYKPAKANHAR